jgi:hypothetical protein
MSFIKNLKAEEVKFIGFTVTGIASLVLLATVIIGSF